MTRRLIALNQQKGLSYLELAMDPSPRLLKHLGWLDIGWETPTSPVLQLWTVQEQVTQRGGTVNMQWAF